MSDFTIVQTLVANAGSGAAVTNTASATTLLPGMAKFVLPSNFFSKVGTMLRLHAAGQISTAASAPGTLTLAVLFGTTTVFSGGASPTLAVSATNLTWDLDMLLNCTAIGSGATATILGTGKFTSAAVSAVTPSILLPLGSPAAGAGFDSTAAQTIDLQATWSVASASNSMQLFSYVLESLN